MSRKRNLPNHLDDLDSFRLFEYDSDSKPRTPKRNRSKRRRNDIETPLLESEHDDTFYTAMDELYETLNTQHANKNISEIITELEDALKKKISENNYPATIIHYKNMLTNINNLTETQKQDIETTYNSDIPDKHNVINAIINGDKIITARPYRPYKSPENKTNKRKRGGNKSKKSKKNMKSKK